MTRQAAVTQLKGGVRRCGIHIMALCSRQGAVVTLYVIDRSGQAGFAWTSDTAD